MRLDSAAGPAFTGRHLTYCLNVHATETLDEIEYAIRSVTIPVARAVSTVAPFGLGLRLGMPAVRTLLDDDRRAAAFARLLADHGLYVFTLNGFPQAPFQHDGLKAGVYLPDWTSEARLDYTLDLARLLVRWLPSDDRFGTISTVPLGRRDAIAGVEDAAAANLIRAARGLRDIGAHAGARLMLCLEPEPDCALESAADVTAFFAGPLARAGYAASGGGNLGVCLDACHHAVLFEDITAVIDMYAACGVAVGKVQLSSAVVCDADRPSALAPLLALDETRFLHQTAVRDARGAIHRFADLPDLAAAAPRLAYPIEARSHVHVPIDRAAFPGLRTTDSAWRQTAALASSRHSARHFEVETYTFDVLPPALRGGGLTDLLVRELRCAREALCPTNPRA